MYLLGPGELCSMYLCTWIWIYIYIYRFVYIYKRLYMVSAISPFARLALDWLKPSIHLGVMHDWSREACNSSHGVTGNRRANFPELRCSTGIDIGSRDPAPRPPPPSTPLHVFSISTLSAQMNLCISMPCLFQTRDSSSWVAGHWQYSRRELFDVVIWVRSKFASNYILQLSSLPLSLL